MRRGKTLKITLRSDKQASLLRRGLLKEDGFGLEKKERNEAYENQFNSQYICMYVCSCSKSSVFGIEFSKVGFSISYERSFLKSGLAVGPFSNRSYERIALKVNIFMNERPSKGLAEQEQDSSFSTVGNQMNMPSQIHVWRTSSRVSPMLPTNE